MAEINLETMMTEIVAIVRKNAPILTGNLRNNAVLAERISETSFMVFVDPNIAPYMPYTTEPWISPRWNGKNNPNEGWWDVACAEASEYVKQAVRGKQISVTKFVRMAGAKPKPVNQPLPKEPTIITEQRESAKGDNNV